MSQIIDPSILNKNNNLSKLLPDDVYRLVVDSAQVGTASTGRPRISVTWRVKDGPHAGSTFTDFYNAPFPTEGPEEAARVAWRLGGFMMALSLPAMSLEAVPHVARGREASANVGTTQGNKGGRFNTVTQFYAPTETNGQQPAEAVQQAQQVAAGAQPSTNF